MSDYLFDPSLLTDLPTTRPNLTIRPLRANDHALGYDTILHPLASDQAPLSQETFRSKFALMVDQVPRTYHTIVVVDSAGPGDRIVGSSTLLLEHKFLRSGAVAGHIEDVVVSPSHQGQKLGRVMVEALTALARRLGCYKVILDCSPENVGFYEKCGYQSKGIEMKRYLAQ
ncbi:protein of unknown function [Taphrina deformans PYCC 5710]|uniref:Glucosamine 6-phosphate N-acetyltransferase n=1 Tax=Taphrina deformans (strain PYCC 5710 / ATCC 11124 / CBS 356.35 / IMI 108563 / JCM 9778 / NBRC 8474) TaxID=1097556 RepID=R4XGJ1_TAPDE|nr:protein of unknown function [Taphrina deformans PYCC 5710]|eukprot:CCG85012.1 protein of unknown function [Taphrina deformans PYCC 5710]